MAQIKDAMDAMKQLDIHKSKKLAPLTVEKKDEHWYMELVNEQGNYFKVEVYDEHPKRLKA